MPTIKLTNLSCEDLEKLAEVPALRDLALKAMKIKGCPVRR